MSGEPALLLVEDDPQVRGSLELLLKATGYRLQSAASIATACELLAAESFDLVVSDINLPDGSGLVLLQRIREAGTDCEMVMMTGQPEVETVAEALRLGAFDYLSKPLRPERLAHTLHLALRQRQARRERDAAREQLEAVFRSVKDAVLIVDPGLQLQRFNPAAENLLGLSNAELEKSFVLPGGGGVETLYLLQAALDTGVAQPSRQLDLATGGEGPRLLRVQALPLLDSQQRVTGAILVASEEPQAEQPSPAASSGLRYDQLVGNTPVMRRLYAEITACSEVSTQVLLRGPVGSGKRLVAATLHYQGGRRLRTLQQIDCAAHPPAAMETILFGKRTDGSLAAAGSGTLYLGNIELLPQALQVRLYLYLKDPPKSGPRVIAGTTADLRQLAARGDFQPGLLRRLQGLVLSLPTLAQRGRDIPLLLEHFRQRLNRRLNLRVRGLTGHALELLQAYSWPGNVAELEEELEAAMVRCRQGVIAPRHLSVPLLQLSSPAQRRSQLTAELLHRTLEGCRGNKAAAARLLGVSRQTVYRKLKEFDLS